MKTFDYKILLSPVALYSRMISPFFDLHVGLRQDVTPEVSRTYAVVGVQGLAPSASND